MSEAPEDEVARSMTIVAWSGDIQKCRMPVPLTSRGIKGLSSGQVMVVLPTDGGSQSHIPSWAKDTGNKLLDSSVEDGVYRYLIKKS